MPSAAGEALQRLPASVPAFWICTPPISRAASFSPSKQRRQIGAERSVQVTPAPMRKAVASVAIRRSAAMAVMSSRSSLAGRSTRAG